MICDTFCTILITCNMFLEILSKFKLALYYLINTCLKIATSRSCCTSRNVFVSSVAASCMEICSPLIRHIIKFLILPVILYNLYRGHVYNAMPDNVRMLILVIDRNSKQTWRPYLARRSYLPGTCWSLSRYNLAYIDAVTTRLWSKVFS